MALVINLKADTRLVDRSENTTRFYKDVRHFKPLTAEEEIEWFKKMKHGTPKEREYAREYIIKHNQRLSLAAAKNWATTDSFMDFTNIANIGLIQAVEAFDYTRGVKFASFAMWYIKRAINEGLAESQMVKRTNYSKTFHVVSKATNKFIQENERTPTSDELMEIVNSDFNKDIKDKNDLLDVHVARIDVDTEEDNDYTYGDVGDFHKASASYNDYEIQEHNDFNTEFISKLLVILTPREQEIIKLRFGLSDKISGEYQYEDIAERFHLTKERVRQIEKESLKKMKEEYIRRINKLI
jgi:RNA polymerase sigma factor (sigma-70 family)